jgi:hypothetical protein
MERKRPPPLTLKYGYNSPFTRMYSPYGEPMTDDDIKLIKSFHPSVICTHKYLLSLLHKNIATEEAEIVAYQENIEKHKDIILHSFGLSIKDIMKLMKSASNNSYYYLYTSYDHLSEKMGTNPMSLIFIININGELRFSFCDKWV